MGLADLASDYEADSAKLQAVANAANLTSHKDLSLWNMNSLIYKL